MGIANTFGVLWHKFATILRYHTNSSLDWLPGASLMTRDQVVLAVMSTASQKGFRPVQIQKLFFLVDDRFSNHTGGPHFVFEPYDYGPFDQSVYHKLDELERDGYVEVTDQLYPRCYSLTDAGQELGEEAFSKLDENVQEKLEQLSKFVRALSFGDLVSAIYREYPEMKVNSVFSE